MALLVCQNNQDEQQQQQNPIRSSTQINSSSNQFNIVSLDQLANPPLGQQPNYPWWTIIRAAIMGSRYGILTRDEICDALSNRWDYFRNSSAQATRIWKSAVGHNLSVKECFVRVFVKGKGSTSYYIVDTAVDPSRGRLSRAKGCAGNDRATVPPTIARRLVLPQNFDLSTRARWSPAIAAIRNAKFGFPTPDSEDENSNNRNKTIRIQKSLESQQNDYESSDSESESGHGNDCSGPIRPRLGSSLVPSLSQTKSPVPRLAFSRSLSNALIDSGDSPLSLRRRFPASTLSSAQRLRRKRTRPQSASQSSLHIQVSSSPLQQPQALLSVPRIIKPRIIPIQGLTTPPESESTLPDSTNELAEEQTLSLDDQVAAALADVRACLPQLTEDGSEMEQNLGQGDVSSSCISSAPIFDLENFVKELQAQVFCDQEPERLQSEQQPNFDHHEIMTNAEISHDGNEDLELEIPTPTEADFEKLLASVCAGGNNLFEQTGQTFDFHPANDQSEANQGNDDTLTGQLNEEISFSELQLLQDLIDQATQENQHQEQQQQLNTDLLTEPQGVDEHNQDNSEDCLDAAQMLDLAIEEALVAVEEEERQKKRKIQEQEEQNKTSSSSPNPSTSQYNHRRRNLAPDLELTPSGDIPVHPLPLESNDYRSRVSIPNSNTIFSASPSISISHSNVSCPKKPNGGSIAAIAASVSQSLSISSHRVNQRRQKLSSTAKNSSNSSALSNSHSNSANGGGGRRLNLPLPSSHTSFDDRIDETALAPSFLESIEVVTLERPRNTFPELAKEAIQSHPGGKMTAAEIFKVVEKKYPFFITAPESWKATMRNVLTSHSCFVKIPRPTDAPGRGDWWSTVDLPLWKRRRTTAKAKQNEDFLGRHALEQIRKINNNKNLNSSNTVNNNSINNTNNSNKNNNNNNSSNKDSNNNNDNDKNNKNDTSKSLSSEILVSEGNRSNSNNNSGQPSSDIGSLNFIPVLFTQ